MLMKAFFFSLFFPSQHIFSYIWALGQCSSEAKEHFCSGFPCKIHEAGISRVGVTLLCYFNLQQECSWHPRHFRNSDISNDPLIHSLFSLYYTTLFLLTFIPFSPSHTIRSVNHDLETLHVKETLAVMWNAEIRECMSVFCIRERFLKL